MNPDRHGVGYGRARPLGLPLVIYGAFVSVELGPRITLMPGFSAVIALARRTAPVRTGETSPAQVGGRTLTGAAAIPGSPRLRKAKSGLPRSCATRAFSACWGS